MGRSAFSAKGRLGGLFLLLATCVPGIGAIVMGQPAQAQQAMPSAAQLAANVDHFYDTLHSLRAQFTEIYAGPGVDRSERGVLLLAKPGRMRWDYAEPAGKVFLIDGHDAIFYAPGGADAQKMPVKKLDDLRSPLRFLLGRTRLEKELDGLTVAQVNGLYRLQGVPHVAISSNGSGQVTSLSLDVTADGEIQRIASTQQDGTTITFVLTKQERNPAVAADAFHFVPPPGVKVVESSF